MLYQLSYRRICGMSPPELHWGTANPYEKILRGERSLTGD